MRRQPMPRKHFESALAAKRCSSVRSGLRIRADVGRCSEIGEHLMETLHDPTTTIGDEHRVDVVPRDGCRPIHDAVVDIERSVSPDQHRHLIGEIHRLE